MDAVVHYTFLCQRRPSTYLEVGSGYSTMFARRAITDHDRPTRVVSIDPQPRADVDRLCDEVIRTPLERSDLSLLTRLEPGDVLVLDGTHTAFMNSDSVVAFLDVLPFINSGVLVVIDDIFLPSDYPPTWEGRWYGEQYLLATMLLAGAAGWTVRFPSWYVVNDSALAARLEPVWPDTLTHFGKVAKSFWIERQA
ncbi:MAG TPA: class I SAM-dependent methyltransferase [Acidimicrobiales bacterium]